MRVGILTFHYAHNYGAVLQAYALKNKIMSMGHQVDIINYKNNIIQKQYCKKLKINKTWLNNLNYIEKFKKKKILVNQWKRKWLKFNQFIELELLNKPYKQIKAHVLTKLKFDVIICGSDQIWTSWLTGGLSSVYLLDFKTSAKKVAYAASMFSIDMSQEEEQYLLKCLRDFSFVSTREYSLCEYLKNKCKKPIFCVADPTILLQEEDYSSLYFDFQYPKPFVFAYFVTEDKRLADASKQLADKLKIELIELHYYKIDEKNNYRADFGPEEFLYFIKNADFVMTNSFHGTIFSVIFKKQFYAVYDKDERKDSLLNELHLESRHLGDNNIDNIDLSIDYHVVEHYLNDYRKSSLDFLEKALNF